MGRLFLHYIQQYSGSQHKVEWHKMKPAVEITYIVQPIL